MINYYCYECETVFSSNDEILQCKECESSFIQELRDEIDAFQFLQTANHKLSDNSNIIDLLPPPFDEVVAPSVLTFEERRYKIAIPESALLLNENHQNTYESTETHTDNVMPSIPSSKPFENNLVNPSDTVRSSLRNVAQSHTETMDSFDNGTIEFIHSVTQLDSLQSSPDIQPETTSKENRSFFDFFRMKPKTESFIKIMSIKATNFSERDECSICLRNYKSTNHVRLTQCGHKFHEECLKTWIKTRKECPICRFHFRVGLF